MKYFISIFLLFIGFQGFAQKKALIVSGGGARGAWGGGVAQKLVLEDENDYEVVIGTSTGSLMAPLVVAKDFDTLKTMYTTVNQRSIFSVNPFKFKEEDGEFETKIRGFRAVMRLICGKPTLGETKRLRKLIDKTYTKEKYRQVLDSGEFIIATANFTNGDTYYFSSNDLDSRKNEAYRDVMLDYIWRSSNQPLFMTLDCSDPEETALVARDMDDRKVTSGECWVDAGVRETIPLLRGIQYLLDCSPKDQNDTIDVIINNIQEIDLDNFPKKKILPSILRTIDIMKYDVRFNDVAVPGELIDQSMQLFLAHVEGYGGSSSPQGLTASDPGGNLIINFHYMPKSVYQKHSEDLRFEQKSMAEIWEEGESGNIDTITEKLPKDVAELMVNRAIEMHLLCE